MGMLLRRHYEEAARREAEEAKKRAAHLEAAIKRQVEHNEAALAATEPEKAPELVAKTAPVAAAPDADEWAKLEAATAPEAPADPKRKKR